MTIMTLCQFIKANLSALNTSYTRTRLIWLQKKKRNISILFTWVSGNWRVENRFINESSRFSGGFFWIADDICTVVRSFIHRWFDFVLFFFKLNINNTNIRVHSVYYLRLPHKNVKRKKTSIRQMWSWLFPSKWIETELDR